MPLSISLYLTMKDSYTALGFRTLGPPEKRRITYGIADNLDTAHIQGEAIDFWAGSRNNLAGRIVMDTESEGNPGERPGAFPPAP